ncbi:MAG: hypothetical protein JWM58_3722 [Rhizobium sp.]|nr:hypothetical protein [Rhizobium sp.]
MVKQSRSEKLGRLVKVQRHLEHMAEADLAATTRARHEIQENLVAVVDAIGSLAPIHQIFAGLYSGQISRLTAKDQHLETVQQIHENKMMREKAKGDRLEENRKEARVFEDREADDNAVYDIIDQQIALKFRSDDI